MKPATPKSAATKAPTAKQPPGKPEPQEEEEQQRSTPTAFIALAVFLGVVATAIFSGTKAHTDLRPPRPIRPYLTAAVLDDYALFDPAGKTILANGRILTSAGKDIAIGRWPHGLILSPDGKTAFVACDGAGYLLENWESGAPVIRQLAPGSGNRKDNGGGAAFSPDASKLYWSTGDSGGVYIFDVASGNKTDEISLNVEVAGKKFADSYANDIALAPDGRHLYCADTTNFRLAIIDTVEKKTIGSVAVGRYPYALSVSGDRVYVANIGQYEYTAVPAPAPGEGDPKGLMFPPFGVPSEEAEKGVHVEGRDIKGLGKPNVLEAFSVSTVDASNPAQPKLVTHTKTGLLVGAPAENGKTIGGSCPNYVLASGDIVYVSNSNNDIIEKMNVRTGKMEWRHKLAPSPLVADLRGVVPAGMALSPDGKRLFVTEAGINAVAVLETSNGKEVGHIPTAQYPYRIQMAKDGKKFAVICFKGYGNGPNAGDNIPKSDFLGLKGVFTIIDVPTDAKLGAFTQQVRANNGMVDRAADVAKLESPVIPTVPGRKSEQIKYVVFITKENHTYDAIFDRIPGAKHDPRLLRWGYDQKVEATGQPTLEHVSIMRNHNALARQFTVSDNFYMELEASGVGHRWLIGVQPNNLMQMTYTLGWRFKKDTTAPGRLYSMGSNGSILPEEYPEAGSMWEHLARHAIPFRNYGEGFEFPGVNEDEPDGKTGAREQANYPMSKVLYDNTCRDFPIFNMAIPDFMRAKWFKEDFTKLFIDGGKEMPKFINIAICNDHGTGPKPDKGYPYRASWMADNDLALGQIVDFLSHTKYWKNMAIFVTQDDSGGEPDHVNAQRSVLLVISPWAKRKNVSHRHTTILSMHRTLYQIMGLPALNQFDALANDFSDCFTDKPDFSPYTYSEVDKKIFDPAKTIPPKDPNFKQARKTSPVEIDDPEDMEKNINVRRD